MYLLAIALLNGLLQTTPTQATEADSFIGTPKHLEVRFQYAGNLGVISVGLGREFVNPRLAIGLSYGYLPKEVNGAWVHTFGTKATFNLVRHEHKSYEFAQYMGTSITYSIASKTYTEYPSQFPRNYHIPNAVHVNPLIGARLSYYGNSGRFRRTSLFAEIGTVDYLVIYGIRNKNLKPSEIINLSFGLAFGFDG
jgi:hypothetical protein